MRFFIKMFVHFESSLPKYFKSFLLLVNNCYRIFIKAFLTSLLMSAIVEGENENP